MTTTNSVTEHSRSIIEQFYAAGADGDVETMMSYLADDALIYEPPFLPFGGEYHGREGLVAISRAVAEVADASQFTVHSIMVDGDRAVAFGGFLVGETGQFTLFAEETRLVDGKIAEIRIYYHDAQSLVGPRVGVSNPI
ncbi:nuclear transport factor 2 family protein [Mycolicibacterium sp. P1-5]|uniref:nuclear transport factor 2 family protein n=1 Tax=Mycolicibacterium sp. P1-5 TaxID=2024617 RepID=UPI0011EBD461|nr:nuclear transport factor 2 family protein [Mycolicibacterium sp. P1-5]KAA0107708.1 nuclear transport factor 2 family protein [Mycolicibacterium sp. P1-5]